MTSTAVASAANDDSAWGATQTPSVEQFETTAKQIGTLMTSVRETTDTPQVNAIRLPSVDHILDTPLPQLLTEHHARIVEVTSIDDHRFFGQLVEKRNGDVILAMPAGRAALEQDCAARILIAHLNGLPLGRFPNLMTVTDIVKNGVDVL